MALWSEEMPRVQGAYVRTEAKNSAQRRGTYFTLSPQPTTTRRHYAAQSGEAKGGDYGNYFPELIIIKPAFSGKGYEYV